MSLRSGDFACSTCFSAGFSGLPTSSTSPGPGPGSRYENGSRNCRHAGVVSNRRFTSGRVRVALGEHEAIPVGILEGKLAVRKIIRMLDWSRALPGYNELPAHTD